NCALSLLEAKPFGYASGHRLDLNPKPPTGDLSMLLELCDYHFGGSGRDIKSNADGTAGRRIDRGVHPDHITIDIERGATRVPLVDRRVDLHVVVIGSGADVAPPRRDDTRGHGTSQAKRIANCDNPVPDTRAVISEFDERKVAFAVHFNKREIRFPVSTDH